MRSGVDGKLERLAEARVLPGATANDLLHLGRLADLVTIPSGEVLAVEGVPSPWSYVVLDGAALLSSCGRPLAVAGAGAWLFGTGCMADGRQAPHPAPVSAVAGSEVEALTFRPQDLRVALDLLPGLRRVMARAGFR